MLGAIIGDIVGSSREWHNVKTENFEMIPSKSRFTDDTVMTLAVAEWLMTDPLHGKDTLVACMQRLGRKYSHAGYGKGFKNWLWSNHPTPYNSYGNGSGMRVSPVGLYASSLEEALELARITAEVSHNHPEGIKGAQAIAACVYLQRNSNTEVREKIKSFIENKFGYNLSPRLEDIRPYYKFDVTCQGSVPIAIMAYLQRGNPVDALRLAISVGGDSDTIGCMTASIASAHPDSAFPKDITDRCRALLTAELLDINDRFEAFISRRTEEDISDKEDIEIRDRVRGSLMAGAAGDALGYAVEFLRRDRILSCYGENGITAFDLTSEGKALVSDDTQMTLFTANGMLMGMTRGAMRGVGGAPEKYVGYAYLDWYYTQTGTLYSKDFKYTWLRDLPQMSHLRAPGATCLHACKAIGQHREVINSSKGCGGIMRVAPMGLFMAAHPIYNVTQTALAGAEIAAVTHRHPLGYLPAAMLTHLLRRLVVTRQDEIRKNFPAMALETISCLDKIYQGQFEDEKRYLAALTRKAVELACNDRSDAENIAELGEGWVAEETWAIALYCAVRHIGSMREAIIASVNHDGDSDSTGSVCGNIMGAIYGYKAIIGENLFCPAGRRFEDTLELHDIILAMADDLYSGCIINELDYKDSPEKRRWYSRYCEMEPAGIAWYHD